MKILLLGEASNFHHTLALGLRALGHQVTVASNGGRWMGLERDIDLSRPLPGKLGGLHLWLRLQAGLKRRLTGYDIVSTTGYSYISLRPRRIETLFNYIAAHNPNIFLTALGTDTDFVADCLSPTPSLPYSEYRIHGHDAPFLLQQPQFAHAYITDPIAGATHRMYAQMRGAVSALYEYHAPLHRSFAPQAIAYGGIPIHTPSFQPTVIPDNITKVRLLLGRHRDRQLEKGTDILEAAARAVVERHPDKAELIIVENRPYAEYVNLLRSAHILLDQLYSLTPATNALMAMAYGIPAVTGGDERFYSFISEPTLRPILHVEPTYQSAYTVIESAILNPTHLHTLSIQSRAFVEKHNHYITVARRFLDHWTNLMQDEKFLCKRTRVLTEEQEFN